MIINDIKIVSFTNLYIIGSFFKKRTPDHHSKKQNKTKTTSQKESNQMENSLFPDSPTEAINWLQVSYRHSNCQLAAASQTPEFSAPNRKRTASGSRVVTPLGNSRGRKVTPSASGRADVRRSHRKCVMCGVAVCRSPPPRLIDTVHSLKYKPGSAKRKRSEPSSWETTDGCVTTQHKGLR